jgi:hypothetical protein
MSPLKAGNTNPTSNKIIYIKFTVKLSEVFRKETKVNHLTDVTD